MSVPGTQVGKASYQPFGYPHLFIFFTKLQTNYFDVVLAGARFCWLAHNFVVCNGAILLQQRIWAGMEQSGIFWNKKLSTRTILNFNRFPNLNSLTTIYQCHGGLGGLSQGNQTCTCLNRTIVLVSFFSTFFIFSVPIYYIHSFLCNLLPPSTAQSN